MTVPDPAYTAALEAERLRREPSEDDLQFARKIVCALEGAAPTLTSTDFRNMRIIAIMLSAAQAEVERLRTELVEIIDNLKYMEETANKKTKVGKVAEAAFYSVRIRLEAALSGAAAIEKPAKKV
jgi:hypothetical protein